MNCLQGSLEQLTVACVGADGGLKLCWVVGMGTWMGPAAIGSAGLAPPGAHLAMARQFIQQLNVYFIGSNGALYVAWVSGAEPWKGPIPVAPAGSGKPGGLVAAFPQTPRQLDIVFRGADDRLRVSWVSNAAYQGPVAIGNPWKLFSVMAMFTHLQCASGRLLEVAAAATSCDLLECAFGCSLQQARLCSSCQLCFSSSLLLCENYISLDCVSTAISHGIIGGAKQCAYGDSIAGGHR